MSEVYFIQAGAVGPIKIGFSGNVARRLVIIGQGLPDRPHLLAVIPGGRELELRLHRALHASRRRNEWFEPTQEVRAVAVMAAGKGLPAIERWLAAKEAEVEIRPLDFDPTDDFEADIRFLAALAFRQAIRRFGKEAVSAHVGKSIDIVESMAAGRSLPNVVAFFNLATLDPGACLPLFARAGDVPKWLADRAARDALDALLAKLTVKALP